MVVLNCGIGLLTPPVGAVLFIGSAVSKVPMERVVKATLPFYLCMIITLLLITFIPEISLLIIYNIMCNNVIQKREEVISIMSISVRLTAQDEKLFRSYAKSNNISLSELFRKAVLEKIEDEYDLEIYRQSLEEYNKNPVSYSHSEVCKMLALSVGYRKNIY